jgi:hypothetical protein
MLNQYFVPVYTSNEVTGPQGSGPAEERAARNQIIQEFVKAQRGTGDVHVYILSPDAKPLASLDIGTAMDTGRLLAALQQVVQKLGTKQGEPVAPPQSQSRPASKPPGALVLHLTARGFNTGSWREFPAENWVVLSSPEWQKMLPPGNATTGEKWQIHPVLSRKLLTNFYPQTEDTSSVDRNRIDNQSLTATVLETKNGTVLVRLDGLLRMHRSFYPGRSDYKPVEARLVGFMDINLAGRRIESMALVTEKGRYGAEDFGAALHTSAGGGVAETKPHAQTQATR